MNKRFRKILSIVGIIISIILLIASIMGIFSVVYLNIIPAKYLIFFIGFMIFLVTLLINIMIKLMFKVWLKIMAIIISFIIVITSLFVSHYVGETIRFLKDIKESETVTESYYLITRKDSTFTIKDLEGKEIGTFKEDIELYNNALKELKKEVNVNLKEYDSVDTMARRLMDGAIDVIFISGAHKGVLDTDLEDFLDATKIIHNVDIEVEIESIEKHVDINVSEENTIIYVSGVDSFGAINMRGRSDVNMLITINPNNNEILLTSIPRDYYVQLYGTSGYKDKLTHSGFYGINTSINTIEDILDIKIGGYIKVNFSTLVGAIDAIGGIDVYSDKAFKPYTNGKVYINKGINHMNGEVALAFARERMIYSTGDRHRIQNQQDVFTAVAKKVTGSPVLLTSYTSILDGLNGTFETNIDMNDITSLVRLQLEENPSWKIKTYNLNGYDHSGYTHTFGNQLLYVMKPDERTIEQAKIYINGMLDGKTFKDLGLE